MSSLHVFRFEGKLAPENAKFGGLAEALKKAKIIPVEFYSRDNRRCCCFGDVVELYEYGNLKIISVLDRDEPLAWAMVLNDDGTVTHYTDAYDVLLVNDTESVASAEG